MIFQHLIFNVFLNKTSTYKNWTGKEIYSNCMRFDGKVWSIIQVLLTTNFRGGAPPAFITSLAFMVYLFHAIKHGKTLRKKLKIA